MELQKDALIVTHDGREIGHLDRVTINPRTKEVTHLVVRKGLLFPVDKVIEMSYVAGVTPERITLSPELGDPEFLPLFEVRHYVDVNEPAMATGGLTPAHAPRGYWYIPGGSMVGVPLRGVPDTALPAPDLPPAGQALEVDQNIPDSTVALKEGARVIAEDGDAVGQIVRIFADGTTGRATHFLISQGLLNKEHKAIPAEWVGAVTEDEVRLLVGAEVVAAVPEYEEDA